MADFPVPDPKAVKALGDAVNEIYRRLPDNPLGSTDAPVVIRDAPMDASAQAVEVFGALWRFVNEPRMLSDRLMVQLNPAVAGEVLTMAVAGAFGHQDDDHSGSTWVGCEPWTELVNLACLLYSASLRKVTPPWAQ